MCPRGRCFFSSRRRHTRLQGDWSSDVCSSDLLAGSAGPLSRNLVEAAADAVGVKADDLVAPLVEGVKVPAGARGHAAWRTELRIGDAGDRKSTRLNSSHLVISYAVFCLKKKNR